MGDLYRDGIGVKQSYEEAAKWYRKLLARRVAGAKKRLAEVEKKIAAGKKGKGK
jgi:TPR repeat protein